MRFANWHRFMRRFEHLAHILNAVHNNDMRTRANVNLDNDAYGVATAFAAARGIALGAAISELIRRTEQAPELPLSASSKLKRDRHGVLIVKAAGPVITSEMVREESEDDLD
jgi:hypothetical protein